MTIERLFRLLGLATQKDLKMLRDDLLAEMDVLSAALDKLEVDVETVVADAKANAVSDNDVAKLKALTDKVNALDVEVMA